MPIGDGHEMITYTPHYTRDEKMRRGRRSRSLAITFGSCGVAFIALAAYALIAVGDSGFGRWVDWYFLASGGFWIFFALKYAREARTWRERAAAGDDPDSV